MELINFAYLNIAIFSILIYLKCKIGKLKRRNFKNLQLHECLVINIPILYKEVVELRSAKQEDSTRYSKTLMRTCFFLLLFNINNYLLYSCTTNKCSLLYIIDFLKP